MLQSIRDRTQGWIAGVIISLVILSFALWGIHSYMVGATNRDAVAEVNGTDITKKEFAATYERLRRQALMSAGSTSLPEQTEIDLRKQALTALIDREILKQGSIAQDYRISSSQVDSYLASMPEFQVDGRFSLSRFQQLLATTSYTASDFLELIKTTLLIEQPRLGIIFGSFALPNEVNDAITLVNQERDVAYMTLPLDHFLKQQIAIPENEIQAYYEQHQDAFKTAQQVSIDYIELSTKDLMADIHPTDEALKSFYEDNLNSYTHPMQWNLEKILVPLTESPSEQGIAAAQKVVRDLQVKITGGADFSTIAHQYQDTEKFEPWMTLNQLPSDLQKSVSLLTKPGQISEAIRTKKGFVLLKAIGIKPAQVKSFDEVKTSVRDALAHQQAEEKFADLREKLANATYESPDSLAPAAKALGLSIKSTGLFSQDKGNPGDTITEDKKIRAIAFSEDVFNSANNSDVIPINSEAVIVLRVKSHVPAALLSLDTVRTQIVDKLKAEKAAINLAALADEIDKKLQKGISADEIAKQYSFSWNKVGYIGRYSNKVDSAILYTAFRMPRPKANQALYADVKLADGGYAIVATKAVRDGSLSQKQQYEVFSDQVQNSQGLLEYKLYEDSLRRKAKIESYVR